MFQLILGIGLTFFTLGGLSERPPNGDDPLPQTVEAIVIGLAFALAAMPTRWALLPRAVLILPSFLVFLDILEYRSPPIPFGAAFFCAGCVVLLLTAYTAYLSEVGRRPKPVEDLS